MNEDQSHRIVVTQNGPYVITGDVPLSVQTIQPDANGESWEWKEGQEFEAKTQYALCRCGQSGNKPFCDVSYVEACYQDRI